MGRSLHQGTPRSQNPEDWISYAATFVADVIANYDQIWMAKGTSLFLVKRDGSAKAAVLELTPGADGGHYAAQTALLYCADFFCEGKGGRTLLRKRPGPDVQTSPSHPGGQNDSRSIRPSGPDNNRFDQPDDSASTPRGHVTFPAGGPGSGQTISSPLGRTPTCPPFCTKPESASTNVALLCRTGGPAATCRIR